PTPVFIKSLNPTRLDLPLVLYGRLSPAQSVLLSPSVTETLSAVHVKDGQKVKAGDVLFEMTRQEEQALLSQARAQFKDAQAQFARAETLLKAKLTSLEAFGIKQATFESAQAQLTAVEARLADRLIRAPFDGRLGLKAVNPGDLVRPGDTLAQLEGPEVFHLDIEVPQAQARLIQLGTPFEALSLDDSHTAEGKVLALDNRLQPNTLTLLARGQVAGPGWLAGERVKVRIEHSIEGLTLPEGALVQEGTQSFVFRIEAENKVSRQTVQVKARSGGQVVVAGVNSGDKIVTQGTAKLTAGAKVAVLGEDTGKPLSELLPRGKP
ncbi:MAG TPA: efflux RND transporter periplasmic adaptor subunit, partial [Cellvibrionaceae bacterium]|nr:efflux RND transporter periplasmic adaptor subunit [Cellvibrionaceae bacterium]